MNKFDTIKLKVDEFLPHSVETNGFYFDHIKGTLKITSKLLKGRLIDCNNIAEINHIVKLKLNLSKHIQSLTVLSVDVTKDCYFPEYYNDYLNDLALLPFRNLNLLEYPNGIKKKGGKIQSLVYTSGKTAKGKRSTYITIYDKFVESNDIKFKNVVRIEQKFSEFKQLRNKFGIKEKGEVTLNELINAEKEPLSDIFLQNYLKVKDKAMNKITLIKNDYELMKDKLYFESKNWDWDGIKTELVLRKFSPYKIRTIYDSFLSLKAEVFNINPEKIIQPLLSDNFEVTEQSTAKPKIKRQSTEPEKNEKYITI